MFEEICLTCSKHLADDGRAYCSDECENLDTFTSPSISSASSALSSPYLDYTMGGDVPALVPSALGNALNNFQKRDRYSSSSSTSSFSGSVFTDGEEDFNAMVAIDDEYSSERDCVEGNSSVIEGSVRSAGLLQPKSSGLNYARRPSTTNNRSMIPLLHRRTSSTSSSSYGQVPSSTDDDELESIDAQSTHLVDEYPSEREREKDKLTVTSKTKRSRNRASLPAYFSLLQVSSPQRNSPPLSTSSGNPPNLDARASPPTPKLASLLAASGLRFAAEATPRGRRREPESSRSSRRSQSRSRSRSDQPMVPRGRQDSASTVQQVFDWASAPMPRGRPSARRNSSPLPKMMMSMHEFDDNVMNSSSGGQVRQGRGRVRTNELDGPGSSRDAPGYGNGRSGLRERERERSRGPILATAGQW
ncbi:hypothetical protein BJ138DRAFT_1008110 [Hygrophoropsis aurantiaca]|uniref:Uncharacterized protein n=1 Tax=Hygrophoropsis aurantiaca TaxID=72124 RepID=A0ACB8AB92_9AGAM|nr:hypothetical protein BJ138DRAFT_1008110 [Hygrophoropsis aurantiaca]